MQRRANRTAVIRRLCARPHRSAPELAMALGLPMSAVAPLLRQLVLEGLILEGRERGAASGRLLPRYRVDPARLALLGADVGVERVRVVATSLSGHVLASATQPYGKARSAMSCIDSLATTALRVCGKLGKAALHVAGLGVGVPGRQDELAGEPLHGSFLRAPDVPFGPLLAHELVGSPLEGTPLFVSSAADVSALGEFEFGPVIDGPASLLYLSLEDNLHAGIIVDGQLLAPGRPSGGVGHTILQVDGRRCACGRSGCARTMIGAGSLLGCSGPDPVAALRRRLEAGSPEALAAVAHAGACLGTLLHNLALLYRPSRIVVGGPMIALGDALLRPARRALGEGDFPFLDRRIDLSPSHFGDDAVAMGAAALARHRLCADPDGAATPATRRSDAARTPGLFLMV
jgi:predicted NBD/HSP70 family sugar kinase